MAVCLAVGVVACGARPGDARRAGTHVGSPVDTPPETRARAQAGPRLRELAVCKGMPLALWSIAVVAAAWNVIESLLPLRHCARASTSLQDMGQLLTVANVIALALTPAVIVIVERTSARAAACIGAALMSGALGALAFSTSWGVGMAAVLSAQIAYRLVYYPMSAEVGRIAQSMGDTSRLAAFGLSNSVYSLGMLATGGAQTLLGTHCDATQWMLFSSIGVALAGGAMTFCQRRATRESA